MRFTTVLIFAWLRLGAADFSGKWKLDGDVQGNPVTLECSFQQAPQDKFTGKCALQTGESVDVEGALKGDKVNFSFSAGGYTLNYTGVVSPDSVAGDIEVAGTSGSFSGKRAK